MNDAPQNRPTLLLIVSWLVVLLPTAWGLEHTVQSALKLFSGPAASSSAPVAPTSR